MTKDTDTSLSQYSVGERIKFARSQLGLTRQAFSDLIGIPATSLRNYELAKQIPGGDALKAFLAIGISANWLLTGLGSMFDKTVSAQSEEADSSRTTIWHIAEQRGTYRMICGTNTAHLAHEADEDFIPIEHLNRPHAKISLLFSSTLLASLTDDPDRLLLVDIVGDSMHPTLQAGWMAMIDTCRTYLHPGIYAVRIEEEIVCKRLELRPGGMLHVMSDNPAYPCYEVNLNNIEEREFSVLGRVVWFAGTIK